MSDWITPTERLEVERDALRVECAALKERLASLENAICAAFEIAFPEAVTDRDDWDDWDEL